MTIIIVSFLSWLSGMIVSVVPVFEIDPVATENVVSALSFFLDLIAKGNWFFPVRDALLAISVLLGIDVAKLVMFVVNWLIRRIADIIP